MKVTIDTSKTFDHVSRYDHDEPKTVFRYRVLSAAERNYITEKTSRIVNFKSDKNDKDVTTYTPDLHLAERLKLTVQLGLVGWDNATDANGSSQPFLTAAREFGALGTKTVITDTLYESLHPALIDELAESIEKAATLEEAETKN